MKQRLILIGTVAVAVGGVLLLSRLLGAGREQMRSADEDEALRKDMPEYPSAFAETEFQGLDFLA